MYQGAFIDDTPEPLAKAFVRDLEDGQAVDAVFAVRDRGRRETKSGEAFLKLRLADVTGSLDAVVWEDVDSASAAAAVGAIVRVEGRLSADARHGRCLTVSKLRAAGEDEYDPRDLHEVSPHSYDDMVAGLRELVDTVQNPHLRALLDAFFGDGCDVWERYRQAPAAKHYHQAYRHGLLEHCLSVAQGVSALSATFPGIDRDVAVTGALLHDIGKVEAYTCEMPIDLTDVGRLQGEIPLGYYLVRRQIEELPGFPA
ncbi:MAG: 3-5 exoribonuclease, partial [Thermoleophilaceae bacterium]|nr:3-5 exoribonuclease [Thermoleophilaceae bacterium]